MDKNRAIIALVVIVFVIVASMLYVIFASDKKNAPEAGESQTFEEGYTFDIDNEIEDDGAGEKTDVAVESFTEKDGDNEEVQENEAVQKPDTGVAAVISNDSPETGPGSIAAMIAVALGTISAGIVYKKQAKKI